MKFTAKKLSAERDDKGQKIYTTDFVFFGEAQETFQRVQNHAEGTMDIESMLFINTADKKVKKGVIFDYKGGLYQVQSVKGNSLTKNKLFICKEI